MDRGSLYKAVYAAVYQTALLHLGRLTERFAVHDAM